MKTTKFRIINSQTIKEAVARFFDLNVEDFKSKKRTRNLTYPRQIAMFLCRELTDMSLPKVGADFGGRDHTTVHHAWTKIAELEATDPEFRGELRDILAAAQELHTQ